MSLPNVPVENYERVREILAHSFPDAHPLAAITDAMVDATIVAMWRDWRPEYAQIVPQAAPPPAAAAPAAAPVAGIVGYYVANARHERTVEDGSGQRLHAFTGHLPMAHVVLPAHGVIKLTTAIGFVDGDGVLYGSVDRLNGELAGVAGFKPVAYAELITPPRGFNQERFAAVAVYLLYAQVHDPAPSAYLFEAGLAQGGPRVSYYGTSLGAHIPNVKAQYKPTAMSSPTNLYEGWIDLAGRRLAGFHVRVRRAAQSSPHMAVDAELVVKDSAPVYTDPAILRIGAAARVAAIALRMGVSLGDDAAAKILGPILAGIGHLLPWEQEP